MCVEGDILFGIDLTTLWYWELEGRKPQSLELKGDMIQNRPPIKVILKEIDVKRLLQK